MAKTILFVVAAACSLAVAFVMGPSRVVQDYDKLVGTRLNQFDLDVAKRLKIVKFDQETASTREFEVAEIDGLWTIPSKQSYPADAAQKMAEAATCLIDREVLRVAGKSANDHKSLGVIDPSTSKLDSKAEGVGTRVTITDSNDSALADMIIGKAVKDAEGQYHVRNADQDVVYVVNLDPDKLSTKFEDWIEDDLLQLNPRDIQRVNIKDYSAELRMVLIPPARFSRQVSWEQRGEFDLRYDSNDSKWIAERLQVFDPEKEGLVEFKLAENEAINEEALQELRNSLDDLVLVDVERKPAGLSTDLKAGEAFLNDREANDNLMDRGFAPVPRVQGAEPEIISTEGEIVCTLQDGVEYVLRFGNLQIGEEGESASEGKSGEDDSESDDGINRYLFVMARFNESILEKPEMAELPELPEEGETASEEENELEEADADEPASAGGEPEEGKAEEKTEKEEEKAALLAAREMIEKENERRLNEYQDQLKAGQERVVELNERFGDWYYVISNEVYKKIHLGRKEVIKKKEAETEDKEPGAPAGGLPGLPNLPLGGAK